MKNKESSLTEGVLYKQILIFSIPLMFSNLLQVLFNVSDIAVVGKFAGPVALGAVGSTTLLVTLFTGILIGLSGGINVVVALSIGKNNKTDICENVHTAAIIIIITGFLLLVTGFFFCGDLLRLLNTKPEFLQSATEYLQIYFLGMPALAMYNLGNAVLSADGNTRKPLIFLSVSGVVNVGLNLLLVIVFHMDVHGVAIASVTAQYLSAFLIMRELFASKEDYRLSLSKMRVTGDKAKKLLQLGIPSAFQVSIFAFANLFVQRGVNSFDAVVVAGNSAAANADNLVYDIMAAFYTACASFMGQNLGAGVKKRVRQSYLLSVFYSFGVALLLGILLELFGREFLSLFTNSPEVVEAGMERLRIMGISYCVSAFMDCTIAASRALGKTLVPTIVVIMGSCVFRVIWIYTVFAAFQTTTALYLLYIFSWTLTAIAEIIYFIHAYKKTFTATVL